MPREVNAPSGEDVKIKGVMRKPRTNDPFSDELPRLLAERSMSIRALAKRVDVSPSHISRVVRRKDYKTPSPELMRKIGDALDLPHDYFPEYRESAVIDQVKSDHEFRDELYDRIRRKRPTRGHTRRTPQSLD